VSASSSANPALANNRQADSPAQASAEAALPADVDLHARPAADFVRVAMRFAAEIWLAAGEREVNAKSLLSILALGARRGSTLSLRAKGEDAAAAVETLAETITSLRE
jgi:phosphotransferase system HPr (HPr) family protein